MRQQLDDATQKLQDAGRKLQEAAAAISAAERRAESAEAKLGALGLMTDQRSEMTASGEQLLARTMAQVR